MTTVKQENIYSDLNNFFLTVEDVAKIVKAHPKTIYTWLCYKQIDEKLYVKIGKRKVLYCIKHLMMKSDGIYVG